MLRPSAARHAGWYDIIREDDDAVRSGYPIPDVFKVRRGHFWHKAIIVSFFVCLFVSLFPSTVVGRFTVESIAFILSTLLEHTLSCNEL